MRFMPATSTSMSSWEMLICDNRDQLDYCEQCVRPNRRDWPFDFGARFGTDRVAFLSTWEHQTLERILKEL
ncbi:DUF7693 family protein [Pseudomonas silesiensis]|uniref:DUF7693 domain-containing protein n=1 Tax=Pseudomonas fluorescens TaxID=294 RepID=A0A5E7UFC0_PSEFL|nr:hypothetical protein PS928_03587 [Pseudomonas fluorescens]